MLSQNSYRYIEFYLGVPWAGGVFVPLNIRLAPAELKRIVDHAGVDILIVDDTNVHTVLDVGGEKTLILATDGAPLPGCLDYEALLSAARPCEDAGRRGRDLAALFYTSGSTGDPKSVMLTHTNLVRAALAIMDPARISAHSVTLVSSPLFHVSASGLAIPTMMAGGTISLVAQFSAREAADVIARDRVTIMAGVPTMFRMLIDSLSDQARDLSSLDSIIYGGSPMPEALRSDLASRFVGVHLANGYGMTELSGGATMMTDQYLSGDQGDLGRVRSVGRALTGIDVAIRDPDGNVLAPMLVGEVVVRGPIVMKGYWNRPELTAETLRDGWMHTGDLGYLDEEGFLFLAGRLKEMIISGGENVYPVEVENVLQLYPGVAQCVVFGVADRLWGETVHAIVVPVDKAALNRDTLMAHCRAKLAAFKCPRAIKIQSEPLPLTSTGKINRLAIAAAYHPDITGNEPVNTVTTLQACASDSLG